jgi:hypothetical protein
MSLTKLYQTKEGARYWAAHPIHEGDTPVPEQRDPAPAVIDRHHGTTNISMSPDTKFTMSLHQLLAWTIGVIAFASTIYAFDSRVSRLEDRVDRFAEQSKEIAQQLKAIGTQISDLEQSLIARR